MIRDPEIAALRDELERIGAVVAPHSDHLCVRLPLFAAVRVRLQDGNLRCDPIFGPLPRTTELLLTMTGLTALVGGLFYANGPTPAALTVGFAGLMAGVAQVCRFVLTESCVTRVQMLWATRFGVRRDGLSIQSPTTSTPALRAAEIQATELRPAHLTAAERGPK